MVTLICKVCGQPFKVRPSDVKKRKHCSLACRNKSYEKPGTIVKTTCEFCGKPFSIRRSRFKWGRGKYCSPSCQYAAIKSRPSEAKIMCECLNCGQPFFIFKGRLRQTKGAGKYCCRKCRDQHWKGPHNPNYIDGNSTNAHGSNWQAQRRKALKRDSYTCQICDLTDSESLDQFGQPLVVHHKTPFRLFGDDYKRANRLTNLITLCHPCHRIIEAELQDSLGLKT